MDFLSLQEKEKYEKMWQIPEYRKASPADFLTPAFISFFKGRINPQDTAIDFGCGPGRSSLFLAEQKLNVTLVDISDNCLDVEPFLLSVQPNSGIRFLQESLWELSSKLAAADWILCFDVLEHIPEEKIDLVLQGMSERMKQGGAFSIDLAQDGFGKTIDDVLHLTVKPAKWWEEQIKRYFTITEQIVSDSNLICFISRNDPV